MQQDQPGHGEAREAITAVLWRRRRIVVLVSLLCVLGGGVYLLLARPTYSSSAELYIERRTHQLTDSRAAPASHPLNWMPTQCELIQSGELLRRVLLREDVSQLPAVRASSNPLSLLKSVTTVSLGRKNDIITVTVSCQRGRDAAVLANAIVDTYVAYQEEMNVSASA